MGLSVGGQRVALLERVAIESDHEELLGTATLLIYFSLFVLKWFETYSNLSEML